MHERHTKTRRAGMDLVLTMTLTGCVVIPLKSCYYDYDMEIAESEGLRKIGRNLHFFENNTGQARKFMISLEYGCVDYSHKTSEKK